MVLTLQEDSFTSTLMFSRGWDTLYNPDCEAIGLAPPTLSGECFDLQGVFWGGSNQTFANQSDLSTARQG